MYFYEKPYEEEEENEPIMPSKHENDITKPQEDVEITLDKIEQEHIDLLERIAKPNRSDNHGFYETDRLDAIANELKDSPYTEIRTIHSAIYTKKPLEEILQMPEIILVSSHSDIVPGIKTPFSEYKKNGMLKGTYDNLITNAAITILMKEEDLPDNIVFAFTDEEETGRCLGARSCAVLLQSEGAKLTAIALDVTYEGYYKNVLYSLENLSGDNTFLNQIGTSITALDDMGVQTGMFTPLDKKMIPATVEKSYFSNAYGMFDEAFAYAKEHIPCFSFCIPSNGSMHTDSGLSVKQPVFEGYLLSLTSMLYTLTRTHESLIEAYKIARASYVEKAESIQLPPEPVIQYYNSYPQNHSVKNMQTTADILEDMDEDILFELYENASFYSPLEEERFVNDMLMGYGSNKKDQLDTEKQILHEIFRNVHAPEEYEQETEYENTDPDTKLRDIYDYDALE